MFFVDRLLFYGGLLILLGILSRKFSARFGLPALVLVMLVGMLDGSEGIGRIAFENYEIAHGIGTIALVVILFDGGLRTPRRPIIAQRHILIREVYRAPSASADHRPAIASARSSVAAELRRRSANREFEP